MENITLFFTETLNVYLLVVIILGGIFITKYTKDYTRMKDVYKVLLASILFMVVFYFVDEDCNGGCSQRYLITYLTATSFYELIVKWVLEKLKNYFKTKEEEPKKVE